jgi:hypothetical protein
MDSKLEESEFDAKYFSKKENKEFKDILNYARKLEIHACRDLKMRHEVIKNLDDIIPSPKQYSINTSQSINRDDLHGSQRKYIKKQIKKVVFCKV